MLGRFEKFWRKSANPPLTPTQQSLVKAVIRCVRERNMHMVIAPRSCGATTLFKALKIFFDLNEKESYWAIHCVPLRDSLSTHNFYKLPIGLRRGGYRPDIFIVDSCIDSKNLLYIFDIYKFIEQCKTLSFGGSHDKPAGVLVYISLDKNEVEETEGVLLQIQKDLGVPPERLHYLLPA